MKKIFLLVLISLFSILVGCHKEPLPACEFEKFGWVIVENETTYDGWVDATAKGQEVNLEVFLHDGESYDYGEIKAGTVTIWFTFDRDEWFYEYENLSSCEDLTFTWYLEAKKSTSIIPGLKATKNGETEILTPSLR